jgi:LuxR family transcriptional regulator, maltose regulon positive regulatory protein
MADSDGPQRQRRARRTAGPAFELVMSKFRRPVVRPGTVHRSSLVDRLAWGDGRPVVSVAAPAGFGKTTLLSQWAERGGQPFAWVSVEEPDNDPKVLLTYVAEALDAVQPIDDRVFDALASPGSSVPGSVVPRLGAAFASMASPLALVLDDVHVLHNRECRAALSALADHVPHGSRLVLSGRARPPLRLARLRATGKILEIGPADLLLSREESAALLREAGLALGEDEVTELHRRTEGWPAALYLAALYLREGGSLPRTAATFGGANRLVSDYVEAELLSRISSRQRVFLTRTAVLERMSGPLCEAVLDRPGAAGTLADLARSNLLLVPLDGWGDWYRYHHLFRDMLLAELHRKEPGLIPLLRRRAAGWCLRNDLPEEALEYSMAAGDVEAVAGLVEQLVVPTYRQGRGATVQRWLAWLDERGGIERHPMVAVMTASLSATMGRPVEAERFADMVDCWRDRAGPATGKPHAEAYAAMMRAMLCRHGSGQMLADADEAVSRCAALGIVSATPARYQGIARVLCGDPECADASFQAAAGAAEDTGAHEELVIALSERALLAIAAGDWDRAGALAGQADGVVRRAGLGDSYAMPLACAVQARVALHRGDAEAARQRLTGAQRTRHLLTYAIPHMAVQARIELIHAHLALADLAGARTLLREIDELLEQRPGLGTLAAQAVALRDRLAAEPVSGSPGASTLTAAELRLLPLLATDLSFPEIAAELFLSYNTVKSQASSIYRKLGASSRDQAVARSRELGLLEG